MKHNVSPYVYIGYYCNNNCIFCSEADEYLEHLKLKSFDEIKRKIMAVRKKYDFVDFMGREPTTRTDLIEILKFAKSLNFRQVGLTSNGRMFSYPGYVKKILATGVNQIGISLSGATAKTHDSQTRAPGSFKQTIRGIENVVKMKKSSDSLLVNIPLDRLNYFELGREIRLLDKMRVKEINILFIAPLSRRSRTKKIVMKMSVLGKYVWKIVKPYILHRPDLKFLLVEFLPCSLPKEARKYFFPCLEKNSNKVRIPLCKNCPYKNKCDGVLQDYINLYGYKEFKL